MIKLRNKRTRRLLLAMVLALLVAWLVALWAIPAAYAERGYRGIGGEWVLIASVGGAIYLTLAPQAKVRRRGAQGRPETAIEIPKVKKGKCNNENT